MITIALRRSVERNTFRGLIDTHLWLNLSAEVNGDELWKEFP